MRQALFMLFVMLAMPLHAMEIVEEDSTLGFTVLVGAREVSGEIKDWTAEIDLEARQISVTIRTSSATTNDALLDAILHGAAWLDSRTFPNASFTSTYIAETRHGHLARGVLAVRDTQLPLGVTISAASAHAPATYTIRAQLDRTAVGMEDFADTVSRTVEITGLIAVAP